MSKRPYRFPGYRNIFTIARRGKQPLILQDGTSVEFPDTWTKEQAEDWRKYAALAKPQGYFRPRTPKDEARGFGAAASRKDDEAR
jgi:hypothetical protein